MAALACTVVGSDPALAQTSSTSGTAAVAPKPEGYQVQEIVVTAEKRSESINRVGVTVTALSANQLRDLGVKSIASLAQVVPGLSVTTTSQGTPVYALRGVGYNDTALAATPDVSVYVDEVPLPFPVLTTQAGLDLDRVEVLKGPQGVLFGENATGGAINYIAAKPTTTFQAGSTDTYGRFNTFSTEDYISGPLTSNLQGRLSFEGNFGDGWQKSETRDDTLGKKDVYAGRVLLNWEPTGWATFKLNVNGWRDRSDPQAPQNVGLNPEHPGDVPAAELAAPLAQPNDESADWPASPRPYGDQSFYQVALRSDFRLTGDLTLTSLTSYLHYDQNNQLNEDGTTADLENYNVRGNISGAYQEVRIANRSTSRLRWIVGTNFEYSDVYDFTYANYSGSSTAEALGLFQQNATSTQISRTYSIFGDADYDITSYLTVKAGIRYTDTDRTDNACNSDAGDGHVDGLFDILSELEAGTNPNLQPGQCIELNAQGIPGRTYGNLNESNVPFRVGLDFKPTSTSLYYVSITKGYKAGVFPSLALATAAQNAPVPQESVLDYEGGLKLQLMDRKLLVTGAAFYYDYKDKQVEGGSLDPIFGVLPLLISVPKSHVEGAEAAINWTPFRGLTVGLSGTYLDAQIDQYTGYNGDGVIQNLANSDLPFVSKWSGLATAEYSWPLSDRFNGFVGGDVTARTRETTIVGARPIENTNPYALVNLRGGVATSDGKWRLMLWGKNVGDKYYWTNTIRQDENTIRYAGYPASYGVTLSWRY